MSTVEENPIKPTDQKSPDVEKEIYRSCLKLVVKHLNSTLPVLSDSEESERPVKRLERKTPKEKILEKKTEGNSYLMRDVKPSLEKEKTLKNIKRKRKSMK